MKIVFYNETLISGGIEKCLELLSEYLKLDHEIEIVYKDDTNLDLNIVNILSKHAYVHKLNKNDIVNADICIYCRIYLDTQILPKQIIAKKYFLWVHSKPRALVNCVLDNLDFMNTIEKIICVSEEVKSKVSFPEKSIVIHNFINSDIQELAVEIVNPLSYIPDNIMKLVIVSRISFEKGFDRVEKIVKCLIKNNINFSLNIIGKGRKAEPIIRKNLSKYNQVHFLGYMDNPYPYIKASDYLLLLSDYETWGNVISEAKVLGVPCMVADFPSAKEQIENEKNGIIIPLECDDYTHYVQKLVKMKDIFKQNLNGFKYINEINKWKDIL